MKETEALASVFIKTKHKKYGSQPKNKSFSVRYDKKSYSLFLEKKQVLLLTVSGRKRHDLIISKYYQGYFQLEQFITYKAMAKGIDVKYVDAIYASQRCCKYGFTCRSNIKSQSDFRCIQCEFRLNADFNADFNAGFNASRNICSKNLVSYKDADRTDVNQPIVVAEKLITIHQPYAGGS